MHVPLYRVLLIAYALATTVLPACSSQLLSTDPTIDLLSENPEVGEDYSALSVDKCTLVKVSWRYTNMANLSSEQKQVIKCLYKNGAKIVNSESHVDFLSSSIQNKFIPKSFKVNTVLPGVKEVNQERFDKVSFECIKDEKFRHENVLKAAKLEFVKSKSKLVELFDSDAAEREIKRLEEHLEKIRVKLRTKKAKKTIRDTQKNENYSNVTLAADDGVSLQAHKKRKRKFRRIYLQPQPKKRRKRKSRQFQSLEAQLSEVFDWNGILRTFLVKKFQLMKLIYSLKGKNSAQLSLTLL